MSFLLGNGWLSTALHLPGNVGAAPKKVVHNSVIDTAVERVFYFRNSVVIVPRK